MTQFLPPNLLAYFAPREPIPYLQPLTKQPHEKKSKGYSGVGQFLSLFEDPKDTPPPVKIETREEKLERKKREKAEKAAYIREQGIALWDPNNNTSATSDPYKSLFVARVNVDTSESKLKKEFEQFGPIRKVSLIYDKISGKPKGYAFIEYENEKDMHSAYKHGDGKKIEGRRVLVDVERGRTVKGWLPRRLGGGLTDTKSRNTRETDREDRSYNNRDRYDRREKERSRRSRSKERDRRHRSRSREREKERDRGGDRGGRERDRERTTRDRKDRYDRGGYDNDYSEPAKVVSHNNFNDGDAGGFGRRHRSRSRERKRYARSRSRSRSRERKRSRAGYGNSDNNNNNGMDKERHGSQQFSNYDAGTESGEIEEGEDRSYEGEYRRSYASNNGQSVKNEEDYAFQSSTFNQPSYEGYNVKQE